MALCLTCDTAKNLFNNIDQGAPLPKRMYILKTIFVKITYMLLSSAETF